MNLKPSVAGTVRHSLQAFCRGVTGACTTTGRAKAVTPGQTRASGGEPDSDGVQAVRITMRFAAWSGATGFRREVGEGRVAPHVVACSSATVCWLGGVALG